MHFNSYKSVVDFESVLDGDDAFDKVILDLADEGVLKIGVVRLHGDRLRVFRRIYDYFVSYRDS